VIGVPTSLLGLLLFVVLLAPGFAYTLCRERLTAHRPVSAFRETVALVFVGVLCDAVALGVFAVLRVLGPGWTPDVGALLRDPQGYALRHYAELSDDVFDRIADQLEKKADRCKQQHDLGHRVDALGH